MSGLIVGAATDFDMNSVAVIILQTIIEDECESGSDQSCGRWVDC